MFTRCFERTAYDLNWDEYYEVINISEYGFEFYTNGVLERVGLVEDLEETISMLLDDGWVEVE